MKQAEIKLMFTAAALQGMCANPEFSDMRCSDLAEAAINIAECVVEELAKREKVSK